MRRERPRRGETLEVSQHLEIAGFDPVFVGFLEPALDLGTVRDSGRSTSVSNMNEA